MALTAVSLSVSWVENLKKQLFHSRMLDIRLIITSSALRASLAIYHTRAHGVIVRKSERNEPC